MSPSSFESFFSHIPEWFESLNQMATAWTPKVTELMNQVQNMDPKVLFFMLSIIGFVIGIVSKLVKIAALFGAIALVLVLAKYINIPVPFPG
jgi:membrane-bound ClpP family serine protease